MDDEPPPTDDETAALATRGVTKTYGDFRAVEEVTLTVEPGDLHCLVGPNGSGKTTLFRLLAGLTAPTAGTVVRPDGEMGIGFQRPSVYSAFTVAENLSVFGDMVDADPEWRRHLESELGLESITGRRAGALSGGEANKLDLALALLGEPAVVLLDEPLDDLDDVTREEVVSLLAAYRDDGGTVVVATHRLPAFEAVLDRLTVLREGVVAYDGSGTDLAREEQPDVVSEPYLELLED
jgi:ABC-2 type transport system ATP-binding protein